LGDPRARPGTSSVASSRIVRISTSIIPAQRTGAILVAYLHGNRHARPSKETYGRQPPIRCTGRTGFEPAMELASFQRRAMGQVEPRTLGVDAESMGGSSDRVSK